MFRDEISNTYRKGHKEGEKNMDNMEDKLDYYHRQVDDLVCKNNELNKRIAELSRSSATPQSQYPLAPESKRGEGPQASRGLEKRKRESTPVLAPCAPHSQPSSMPLPPLHLPHLSQSDQPAQKGKLRCGPYETEDNDTSNEQSPLNSEDEQEMIQFSLEAN